jgi:hypothetical protein
MSELLPISLALNVVAVLLVAYLVQVSLSRIQAMRDWSNAFYRLSAPVISLNDYRELLNLLTGNGKSGSFHIEEGPEDFTIRIHLKLKWWARPEADLYHLVLNGIQGPVAITCLTKVD